MAAGNGQNGVQQAHVSACAVCDKPGPHRDLCEQHYAAWRLAKESIRFNEASERGEIDAARVAFEDFVRRLRAEALNDSGGDRAA